LRQKLLKRGRVSPLFVYINFLMDLVEEIRRIAEEKLLPSQFILDVVISARKGPKKIVVIADGDNGFNIDDCAELSRFLSKVLDERNLVEDNYLLEVSTPGLDHPLKLIRQYRKNIGRSLKVKVSERVVEGKLAEVDDQKIVLLQAVGNGKNKQTARIEIPVADIEKAFVQVSFK
jgi:ribosome maturation factor RimP